MATIFPPGGPALPSFCTLLIQGPYHPTAPLHLALSYVTAKPSAKALVLSPHREKLLDSLNNALDDWLAEHGGEGRVASAASRVDMLYPGTRVQLSLLLSMFHKYTGAYYHPMTTLDEGTSLIVLHELSSYFLEGVGEATVSSYLNLVCSAIASINSLSSDSCDVSLALFDSGIAQLKLPMVKQVHNNAGTSADSPTKTETVAPFVHKYFEWVGVIESVPIESESSSQPSSAESDGRTVWMDLRGESGEITWKWTEHASSVGRTAFSWPVES